MSTINFEVINKVGTISINREDKKNALTQDMYLEITKLLSEAESRNDVAVVLLRGTDNCFTSGNDLNDFLNSTLTLEHPVIKFLYAIANFTKPLIAAVTGVAVGIGTTMLLHCDLVYCTPSSKFQLPFINLGLTPEAAVSLLLPNSCSYQKAAELLMLGDMFDANTAFNLNFINEIIAEDKIFEHTNNIASKIAKKPNFALLKTKELLKANQKNKVNAVIGAEAEVFMQALKSEDAKMAFKAFLG